MRTDAFRRIALALAVSALLCGCGDDPEVTVPPSVPPAAGAAAAPIDAEAQQEFYEEQTREADAAARKLIESFRGRVYDPVRDDGLRSAVAEVVMQVVNAKGEVSQGRFQVRFDASQVPTAQTVTTPAEGADLLPAGSMSTVQRFASTGFRGGYFEVITYLPKMFLTLFRPSVGKWGVHCPPGAGGFGMSYVFDDDNVIVTRGRSGETTRQIDSFEWENPQGRYLLKATRVAGFPTSTEWEYDDAEHGVGLPSRIVVQRGDGSVELRFTYRDVVVDPSATSKPPETHKR